MDTSIKILSQPNPNGLPYINRDDISILYYLIVTISTYSLGGGTFFKTLEWQLQFIWRIVQGSGKDALSNPMKGCSTSTAPNQNKISSRLFSTSLTVTLTH